MGLLKKKKKKKPFRATGSGAATTQSNLRPQQVLKQAPCIGDCPAGNDIRYWITTIAQREKLKLTEEEAYTEAWKILAETNPFPSTMGRVCPHPCETTCNRTAKEGAVSINALERFIGDWSLEKGLKLSKIEGEDPKEESIAVIGAGPAGLSLAYQLARRGYPVTVYEQFDKAGGMLYWGIPFYRLPADVLEKEIQRICDLGVELKLNTKVGKDISVDDLRSRHKVIFLGIGAHKGKLLRLKDEKGPGVWAGTDYLNKVAGGENVDVGKRVGIIGGGDTAIDAARVARRTGAEVTILYRRTRKEMPAIETEIEDALKEEVKIEYLVAPVGIDRVDGKLAKLVVQRMELGEPDSSGRRRPVPIEGSEYEIELDTLIAAISQEPDWDPIPDLGPLSRWLEVDEHGRVLDDKKARENVWAGGDVIDLGIAATAIMHGRRSAEGIHAELRGLEIKKPIKPPPITKERVRLEIYEEKPREEPSLMPVAEWLKKPDAEISSGISAEQFEKEVTRCMSCGLCYGCERCWMYCTPSCFTKVQSPKPGDFYTIKIDVCDGCKKCADECPCGFLYMI